jgi:lipid-A-disaccharide synthase
MKKVFLVAGELSGDRLAAWYLRKLREKNKEIKAEGIGGNYLKEAGAKLYERFERLNAVGIVEIIKDIVFFIRLLKKLAHYIASNNFDEVVVVDFPGFNLLLIKKLKKLNKKINITYLSPPQLWAWGQWRIKKIKKFCDKVIVLYPFEVDWYKKRGVKVSWLGYPFFDLFEPYFDNLEKKEKQIAILPGSRSIEIKRLFPLFLKVVKRLKLIHPDLRIIIPLAESVDIKIIENHIKKSKIGFLDQDVFVIQGKEEKLYALSRCCLALTKPGTVTLELAMLGVPAIVAYKASWLTYLIAKLIVKIDCMSLPNLLLGQKVYPEFIQWDCTEEKIWNEVKTSFHKPVQFDQFESIRRTLQMR